MAGQVKSLTAKVNNGHYELSWYCGTNKALWGAILDKVRMIPGRQWDTSIGKKGGWKCPINTRTTELISSIGFKIKEDKKIEEVVERKKVIATPPIAWKKETLRDMTDKARNYQVDGVKMMQYFDFNCLLADEAGSGKTLMSLSAVRTSKLFPVLIVCPSSLKLNWKKECKLWLNPKDNLRWYVVQGKTITEDYSNYDIVIINYDVLYYHVPFITKNFKPKFIICDEVHEAKSIPKIKSRYYPEYPFTANDQVMVMNDKKVICSKPSKRTQALNCIIDGFTEEDKELAGYDWKGIKYKLLLSATPFPNNASDIYNILHWIDPNRFQHLDKFLDFFCHMEEGFKPGIPVIKSSKNLDILHKLLIEKYMIRRKKVDILPELPERTKTVIPMMMEDHWWKEYKKADEDFIEWIRETKKKNITTEDQERQARFSILQELALKGKLKSCFQFIDNLLLNKKQKLVVFCHHKKTVDEIMKKYGKICVKLVGGMSDEDKEYAKEQFQNNPKIKIIVMNIKAGATGHTLTAADKVLFIETHYSAHLVDQGIDRCHRIGATSDKVIAYFLQAAGTIEKKIISMLDRKLDEMNMAIDGVESEEKEMLAYLWEEYEKRA